VGRWDWEGSRVYQVTTGVAIRASLVGKYE
jgi:hypothetical protein